jgi:hypothetical protein
MLLEGLSFTMFRVTGRSFNASGGSEFHDVDRCEFFPTVLSGKW